MSLDSGKIKAFQKARAREEVARDLAAKQLSGLIYDAKEAGLTIRETATILGVSKTTVGRYWRGSPLRQCSEVPIWGTEREYMDASAAIWSHEPDRADTWCPYQWSEQVDDNGRVVRSVELVPMGIATFTDEEIEI